MALAVMASAAEPNRINPPVYLHSAIATTDEHGQTLRPDTTLTLPLTLEVNKQGLACVVLPNGVALVLQPGTRLRLEEASLNAPVNAAQWNDPRYEPTQSITRLNLERGTIAIAGKIPNPTSVFTVATPLGQITSEAKRWTLNLTPETLTLAVADGTVNVLPRDQPASDFIQSGQRAIITRTGLVSGRPLTVERTTAADSRDNDAALARATNGLRDTAFIPENETSAQPRRIFIEQKLRTRPVDDHAIRRQ
jgi:hypothetical protein